MEDEVIFSGYCRTIDQSRMVTVEVDAGVLCSVDCSYESCPHTQNCTIAQSISEILKR